MSRTTVVIATRNRAAELDRTLSELTALPERPPIIVVDNASTDGTPQRLAARFPDVRVLRMPRNLGAVARNRGVLAAATPYVAFSDDDSWWAPGALAEAERILDGSPRLALIAARTLVGPRRELDPVNLLMWRSPLPEQEPTPGGRPVLGFLACSAVVRRRAFLDVGGFAQFIRVGGEEKLLAYDLAAAGWQLVYAPGLVAHHHPSAVRDPAARRVLELRNDLLIDWLRRPWQHALRSSARAARAAVREPVARKAALSAAARLPVLLPRRRRLPPNVESAVRMLEAGGRYGIAA
jgi:GT2 family glycosyltransferase